MYIDLTRLRHIVVLDRTGNFTRAAEELGITQPALSRSIATFEQRFEIKLFDRGRGGAIATPAGRLVAQEAERVLRAAGDLEHNLGLYGKGKAGRIAIGLGPLVASLVLPRLSQIVINETPSLQLRASIKPADELVSQLLAGEIEMIFANSWNMGNSPELVDSRVGSIRLDMIVRGGHPLAGRKSVPLSEIQTYPVANAAELPQAVFTGQAGAFVCDNYHILRETVLGTDSVWMASTELLSEDVEAGRLVNVNVADFGPVENHVSMICKSGRTMSPAAQLVARTVRGIFDG